MNGIDDDVLAAAADLVERTGAKNFEIGYLHDDVPAPEAGWYATARGPRSSLRVMGRLKWLQLSPRGC